MREKEEVLFHVKHRREGGSSFFSMLRMGEKGGVLFLVKNESERGSSFPC